MKEIVLTTNIGAMISMLEREKIKLEQFAEENGLSLSMMTQKVREIYDDLTDDERKHITETDLDNNDEFDYIIDNDKNLKDKVYTILEGI